MKKKLSIIALVAFIIVGTALSTALTASETMSGNESPITVSIEKAGCISGCFRASEDDWTGTFVLNSNCTFSYTEREGRQIYEPVNGTYSIDGDVYSGCQTTIRWYVNGQSYGTATLAWPVYEGLMIINNGDVYKKI